MQGMGATWARGMEPPVSSHPFYHGILHPLAFAPRPSTPSLGHIPSVWHALGVFPSVHLISTYPSAESFLIHGTS